MVPHLNTRNLVPSLVIQENKSISKSMYVRKSNQIPIFVLILKIKPNSNSILANLNHQFLMSKMGTHLTLLTTLNHSTQNGEPCLS